MRFSLSPELLEVLRQHRQQLSARREWRDEVEEEYDAFCLDPGMGPALYLTADGRLLEDGRAWDDTPICEATDDLAIAALVSGAKKTGIDALLELIPPPPPGATTCPRCTGTRRAPPHPSLSSSMVCVTCWGRGWATEAMLAEAARKWPSEGG